MRQNSLIDFIGVLQGVFELSRPVIHFLLKEKNAGPDSIVRFTLQKIRPLQRKRRTNHQ